MYTNYAAIAEAYGVTGIKVDSAAEFKPALERAIATRSARRDRRVDGQRADADDGPLEHHGHLLAR